MEPKPMNLLLYIDISIDKPLTTEEQNDIIEHIAMALDCGGDSDMYKLFPKVTHHYIGRCEE